MVGSRIGHYEIIEHAGAGGMGEVYRAHDTRLDRIVALKFLPPALAHDRASLLRFEHEAKAVAALNHPNIVTIYAVEEADGRPFISMEFVDGRTLKASIAGPGLPLERLLQVAVAVADALACVHARGITHRDLKPGNIMLSTDGRVKILDFGLARPAPRTAGPAPASGPETMTQEGVVEGTPGYVAPEQLLGQNVDHRVDLFAFGVVLYEMATGERPFAGATPQALAAAVLRDAPRPLRLLNPELPAGLEDIVQECLDKDPARRPPAAAIRNRCERLRHGQGDAAVGRMPSVAVLPFADMSAEKDQDWFCEGIAEELIHSLARIRNLRVTSRTSAFQFKGAADVREIGRRLDVGTVLEGSVRKSRGRLRITAQLVDVANGSSLWSNRFDRDMQDVFAIQDEVAQSVIEALQVSLHPGERPAPPRPPTASVEAYEHYLRGRKLFYGWGRRNGQVARQMFARAIEIDPDYALAWAGMADCCSLLYMYWERDEAALAELLAEALEASRKALEFGPDLAEAHVSRGLALSLSRQDAAAESEFETAVRANPASFEAYHFYGRHCFARGRHEQAARLYERACAAHPEDYQTPALLDLVYRTLGRKAESRALQARTLRIIEERLGATPDDVRALYLGAGMLVRRGERDRGIEWADRALRIDPEDPAILYNVACVYSQAGRIEGALDFLERSAQAGHALKQWIEHDPDLDPLREDPRYRALMDRLA